MAVSPNLPDGLAIPAKKPKSTSKPAPKATSKPAPRPQPRPAPRPPAPPPSSGMPSQGPGPGSVPAVTKPKPKPPSLKQFLAGDEVYQQALRGGRRTLEDFLSELNRRRGEAGTSFDQTQEQMEQDRVRQLEKMKSEFASRGTLHSSLYGQEQGRFQEQFQTQMTQLSQAQQQLLADIMSQQTNFKREQELAMEMARQEALSRRASRYGL